MRHTGACTLGVGCRAGMSLAVDNSRLDCVVALPRPQSAEEERALVARFLAGVRKLFEAGSDPELSGRLLHALRHSASCPRCAAACHVFEGSGRDERYRPGLRADILRRLYFKHVKSGGRVSTWWRGDVELDWPLVARLAQMAYRCNLCGRCAQSCHAAGHALVARALRTVFHEMGVAPIVERHADAAGVRGRIAEIDQHTSRRAGIEFHTPWDVEGAEVLLVQPASAVLDWPENVGALGLILTRAGIKWTMSSQLAGDDLGDTFSREGTQLLESVRRYAHIACGLKAKKIVVGESGEACRALCVEDERLAHGELNVPRQSVVTLIRDVVRSGRVEFDPLRNDFPVTLHDSCNLVRRGVVEPQREVLRRLCPQFREMDPWAERNYCCGGGGGLVHIKEARDWRVRVAGRKKMDQVLDAFSECLDAETRKYLCAPCGDCKTQLRDLLAEHAPWEKNRILYGGLAELVANSIAAVRPGFLQWEWR
ncbi:MAG: (Fe-S)-binding protein [Acidobacteriia bacterium]|nr:(Fe-S)-binding protein [Terriglobia bacterium]